MSAGDVREEGRGVRQHFPDELVVPPKELGHRRMQRDCTLNVPFGSVDIDDAVFNVHILTVEPAEFVGTCPGAVL